MNVTALIMSTGVFCAAGLLAPRADANAFPAANDLWRLSADEHLIINRGGPVHDLGDVNGDGHDDIVLAAGSGSARVVFGPTTGNNGRLDVTLQGGVGGFSIEGDFSHVGGGEDFNGDGINDIAVSGPGVAHVVFGRRGEFPSALVAEELDGSNGFSVETFGITSVALVPDINGDGLAELAVGNREADAPGFRDAGMLTVVFGQSTPMPAATRPFALGPAQGFIAYGEDTLDQLGWSVGAAGDLNGDGLHDLVVGAPGVDVNDIDDAGRAYIIFGNRDMPIRWDLAALDGSDGFRFNGRGVEHAAGQAARLAGDLNGDGIDDLAIGAPGMGPFGNPNAHPGEVAVVFGSAAIPATLDADALDGENGFVVLGERGGTVPEREGFVAWGDRLGVSASVAGDINADGHDDMIIGAPYTIINEQRRGNGSVYVVYGRPAGDAFPALLPVTALDGNNGFRWVGTGTTDYTGHSVSRARDFNGDGIDDVFFGASGQGESYVVYGRRGN